MRKNMKSKERKAFILKHAVQLAKSVGYNRVTREAIANKAGVTESLINVYFGTMPKLKRQIIRAAVREEVLEVIAQGIIAKDPHVKKIDDELKHKALSAFAG
jgi:AcrR family transcriptional regulator